MPTHNTVQVCPSGVGSKTSSTSCPAHGANNVGSSGCQRVATPTAGLARKRPKRRSVLGTRAGKGMAAAT